MSTNGHNSIWTDELVAKLLRITEGKRQSAREIRDLLGVNISHKSVHSKMLRLGLRDRLGPANKQLRWKPRIAPVSQFRGGKTETAGAALLELGPRQCKWPIGEVSKPGFHFCRKPMAPGDDRYCWEHKVKAMAPELRARLMSEAA